MWKPNFKFGYIFGAAYILAAAAALVIYQQSWTWWLASYCLHILIFGFGVSFGLHKAIAHGARAAHDPRVAVAALIGTLANVGSPIDFLLTHRAHHRFSDQSNDPQNVNVMGWRLLFGMRRESGINEPLTDLFESREEVRRRYYVWLHENYYLILIAFAAAVAIPLGLKGLLFLVLIPSGLSFFALGALNYFGHRKSGLEGGGARNIIWLFPLILSECWHADHHERPTRPLGH